MGFYFENHASMYARAGMQVETTLETVVRRFSRAVIKEALATKNVVIMDFSISREEGVFPMVPAGKATTEMLLV